MQSFMEMIFIDSDGDAWQTNTRHAGKTDAETWAAFNRCRPYAVDFKNAAFLLDYHNRKGDLADTIPVDAAGFKIITGHAPLTDAEYRKIDQEYWKAARAESKRAA